MTPDDEVLLSIVIVELAKRDQEQERLIATAAHLIHETVKYTRSLEKRIDTLESLLREYYINNPDGNLN